jgi:mannosyl-glycoprotein endo-beta-N-acetylglucosaminidase
MLYWDDHREDTIPTALSTFCMDDAWNGGNSLRISISCPESDDELAAYRSLWLPIQSLSLTPQRHYHASIVYKLDGNLPEDVHTEIALALKPPSGSSPNSPHLIFNFESTTTTELSRGWNKIDVQFTLQSSSANPRTIARLGVLEIGLVIAILMESDEPTKTSLELSLLVGQLNVSAFLPQSFTEEDAMVLWADYTPEATAVEPAGGRPGGTLSWEVAACFPDIPRISIASPEDPLSAWNIQPTITWFPSFLYFNIYAQPFIDQWNIGNVEQATWIGTSGWDGQKFGFDVLLENLPFEVSPNGPNHKVRFYVQGVTDHGEVVKWERCAFVDVSM